jgi:phosphohistidine phosphatase SixA
MVHVVGLLIVALTLGSSLPAGSEDPAATTRVSQDRTTPVAPGSKDPAATTRVSQDRTTPVAPGSSDPGGQGVVFLVRHAERADAGMAAAKMAGADPELSDAGKTRAAALAALLKDAKITAIFTTEYKRTRDTAQPLAVATGVTAAAVDSKDAAGLIDRVKASAGNVLVVGHSNTVPDIIKALGVSEPVAIPDDQFHNLFVVIRGAKPTLLRLHYR